jgi:hypothetical protein
LIVVVFIELDSRSHGLMIYKAPALIGARSIIDWGVVQNVLIHLASPNQSPTGLSETRRLKIVSECAGLIK